MTDHERYLFDLQGYLAVPNMLNAEQLAALNAILDERLEQAVAPTARTHRFFPLLDWGGPYLDLIDNEPVLPYLEAMLGPGFRLDHEYADIIRVGKGPIGATLHGGGSPFGAPYYYRYSEGRMYNGLCVVAYNLKDVNPGDGGFAAVPGSHKSNIAFPDDWRELDNTHSIVQPVTGPAGTAIFFTEALTHGTLPWNGADERRTVFFKYSPHALSWAAYFYDADDYPNLTERQRALLEPPNARYPGREAHVYGGRKRGN